MTAIAPQQEEEQILSTTVHNEKTEQQQHDLITPPMSPTYHASSSSNEVSATPKNSLKITAGQTGLPWLAHDAERSDHASPIQTTSPQQLNHLPEATIIPQQQERITTASSPPKFTARPKTTSTLRLPTRKRSMQKHVYSMKDGLDPVKVLLQRLSSWQISVKYLTSMFQSIEKVESATGKGYRKIDAKSSIPVKLDNQFKPSNGIKDAWSAFRQYTRENSLIHQDFVDFIKKEIVPTLNAMLKEIASYKVALKKNKELRTTKLWDYRKRADAMITQLNNDIYVAQNQQENQPNQVPKKDPLLTKYVAINTIQNLYRQENHLHKEFLEHQDKYRQFEQAKIINVYNQLFTTFEEYHVQHHLGTSAAVSKVVTLFQAIEQDTEWLDFVHRHQNQLVKQTATYKDEHVMDFPNAAHHLVQPYIMGSLQRHNGKKWIEEFYVLSPVGLLYRFKNEERFHHAPTKPNLSMFVPQCSVLTNPTSSTSLELRGKTLNGLFGGSNKLFELSATEPHVIKQWVGILGPMSLQQETAVNRDTSTAGAAVPAATAAAVDDQSVHSKVFAEDADAAHGVQEAEPSKSSNSAPSAAAATASHDTINPTNDIMQLNTNEQHPITNASPTTSSYDGNYNRKTIEYSTHTPITDERNVTSTTNNADKNRDAAHTANEGITMNDELKNPPAGPKREETMYWDSRNFETAV